MLYVTISGGSRISIARYNQTMGGYVDPSVDIEGSITVGRNVIIENDCKIGDGCFFGHNAIMRPNCTMGNNSELRAYGWLANEVKVGHHTTIYQYANICYGARLGNYIYFGCKSICTNADDIVIHRGREFVSNPPTFEDGCRIATGVTFLPGITVGKNALIGAGSMVTKNVPAGEVWVGHPAKRIRYVSPLDIPEAWNCNNENSISNS